MAESVRLWVLQKQYEEYLQQFKTAWDLYLKFYTVFLVFNLTAFSFTAEKVSADNRLPIVIIFVFQNICSAGTALHMSFLGRTTIKRLNPISDAILSNSSEKDIALKPPVLTGIAFWAGFANTLSHIGYICCWIFIL
jgi:hypothetical protein